MNDPAASGGVSRELFLFAASSGELNPKEIKKLIKHFCTSKEKQQL